MRCKRCESQPGDEGLAQWRPARPSPLPTCDRCGATIVTLKGVPVRLDDQAQLARFGLAETGAPLLEPKREDT